MFSNCLIRDSRSFVEETTEEVAEEKIEEIVNEIIEMIRRETVIFKIEILIDSICRIYKSITQNKGMVRTKIDSILENMRGQLNFRSIFILEDVLKDT